MESTMNIHAKQGTKITVTTKSILNGYANVSDHAKKHLKVGEVYTIDRVVVHSWYTNVYVKEIPGERFNSVSFTEPLIHKALQVAMSEMDAISKALNTAEQHAMLTQIVRSAIRAARINPENSISDIMLQALKEWDL